jgi:hypothetical protein
LLPSRCSLSSPTAAAEHTHQSDVHALLRLSQHPTFAPTSPSTFRISSPPPRTRPSAPLATPPMAAIGSASPDQPRISLPGSPPDVVGGTFEESFAKAKASTPMKEKGDGKWIPRSLMLGHWCASFRLILATEGGEVDATIFLPPSPGRNELQVALSPPFCSERRADRCYLFYSGTWRTL